VRQSRPWSDERLPDSPRCNQSELERVMGFENTAGAHQPFEIMTLRARRALRAIIV